MNIGKNLPLSTKTGDTLSVQIVHYFTLAIGHTKRRMTFLSSLFDGNLDQGLLMVIVFALTFAHYNKRTTASIVDG
jgi:hypothetical protein